MYSKRNKNPYAILGLSLGASPDDIKRQYRKLAREFHPDKAPVTATEADREALTKRFQEIQNAYHSLTNPSAFDSVLLSSGATLVKPLHEAAAQGDLDEVKRLIVSGEHTIDERDPTDRTALMLAASIGHVRLVDYLISISANLECANCAGHSPLMFAVGCASDETGSTALNTSGRSNFSTGIQLQFSCKLRFRNLNDSFLRAS